MKSFDFYCKWLFGVGIVITVMGLFIGLLNSTPLFVVFNGPIDPVFWGNGAIEPAAIAFKKFVYCLLGSVMTLWGIQVLFVIRYAFSKREMWSWMCLMISTCIWFAIDESFSIYYKVYFNALFNIPFFLALLIPLILSKAFMKKVNN